MTRATQVAWRLQQVLSGSRDAFIEVDGDCRVVEWSHRAEELLGWRPCEMIGRPLFEAMPPHYAESVEQGMDVLRAMGDPGREHDQAKPLVLELELVHRDGSLVVTTARVFITGTGNHFRVGAFLQRHATSGAVSRALARDRLQDPLTQLASRVLFTRRLALALDRLQQLPGSVAIVVFDLDRFNAVNDALGYDQGDAVLIAAARRLRAAGREACPVLARLGGDEFLALIEGPGSFAGREASIFAGRALEALREPVLVDGREIFMTATAGIAATTDGRVSASTMLADADAAMHQGKAAGGAVVRVFGDSIRRGLVERLSTEHDLHRAVDRHELALVYQPVVDLGTGQAAGAEALVRWHHPVHGMIPPQRFIPVAEESGLIIPIGSWILEEACSQLATWRTQRGWTGTPGRIHVNVSLRQLDRPDFARTVRDVLRESGVPPEMLTLEITESALMRDPQAAYEILRTIKRLGVSLAIDDFGVGYSSLGYLKRFPLDLLKVDKSFVEDLAEPQGVKVAAALINLAHALDLKVVAEGVESAEQLVRLTELGCDMAQGYYLGRPQPAAVLAAAVAHAQLGA